LHQHRPAKTSPSPPTTRQNLTQPKYPTSPKQPAHCTTIAWPIHLETKPNQQQTQPKALNTNLHKPELYPNTTNQPNVPKPTLTMQFQHCGGIDWRKQLIDAGAIDCFKCTAYQDVASNCRKPQCS